MIEILQYLHHLRIVINFLNGFKNFITSYGFYLKFLVYFSFFNYIYTFFIKTLIILANIFFFFNNLTKITLVIVKKVWISVYNSVKSLMGFLRFSFLRFLSYKSIQKENDLETKLLFLSILSKSKY